jgi:endonuclease YncB( thermonuclease family)
MALAAVAALAGGALAWRSAERFDSRAAQLEARFEAVLSDQDEIANVVGAPLATPERRELADVTVIDGDTVDSAGVRYRLLGLDAPGVGGGRMGAHCLAERRLGQQARARLTELIGAARKIEAELTGQRQEAVGQLRERWFARLILDGRDVAPVLIGEGLAQPYEGRVGWCNGA